MNRSLRAHLLAYDLCQLVGVDRLDPVDVEAELYGRLVAPLLRQRQVDGGHGVAQHSAIRTDDFKLLYFDRPRNEAEEKSRWELFDLKNDPQEMSNLASDTAHADRLKSMQVRFQTTRKFYDDTDESVWQRGAGKRYPPETYIRPPQKR